LLKIAGGGHTYGCELERIPPETDSGISRVISDPADPTDPADPADRRSCERTFPFISLRLKNSRMARDYITISFILRD